MIFLLVSYFLHYMSQLMHQRLSFINFNSDLHKKNTNFPAPFFLYTGHLFRLQTRKNFHHDWQNTKPRSRASRARREEIRLESCRRALRRRRRVVVEHPIITGYVQGKKHERVRERV